MRRLASAVAIALLGVAGSAHAEAAPGSTLNPSGGDTTRITDERGLSHWLSIRRRSPAGFLFPDPLVPNRLVDLAGGWRYRGSLEFGGLWTLGDGDETRFNEFTDWSEGPFLEFFNLTLAHPESGFYADLNGGSAGRDDQYYYAKVGVPGLVRLEGSFSGIPHVFARDATNLYEGAGSGVLKLPEPLERATSTEPFDDIVAAIKVTDESRLELQRDRTQFSLAFQPLDSMTLSIRNGRSSSGTRKPSVSSSSRRPYFTEAINVDAWVKA